MDQTSLVHLANGCGDIDGKPQERLNSQRRIQQPAKQLASGVFEYQKRLTAILHEFQRAKGPIGVKAFREFEFVGKPAQAVVGCQIAGNQHGDRPI